MVCGQVRNGPSKPQSCVTITRWPMIQDCSTWRVQGDNEMFLQEGPGWARQMASLGTRWQAKNNYARLVPKKCSSFFLPSLQEGLASSTSHSGAASGLREETPLPLLWLLLWSLGSGDSVRLCVSNNPRSKKERRGEMQVWEFVTTGTNWCHAPNVRFFFCVCVESVPTAVMVWLMCVFIVSLQMQWVCGAGKSWLFFFRRKNIVNTREGPLSHVHFLYLDYLRLTSRQLKSCMQALASSLQVDLPSLGCVCWESNADPG